MTTEVKTPPRSFVVVLKDLFVHVFGQIRILKKIYPGIMHFLIFWGMTLLAIGHAILLMQMALFLPFAISIPRDNLYLLFETISDFAGLALLAGGLFWILLPVKETSTRGDC